MSQLDLGNPYTHSPDHLSLLKSQGIEGLPWRSRQVDLDGSSHLQFLVMTADEQRVIASGFSVQGAALAAGRRLQFLARPVEHFSPHLSGASFRTGLDSSGCPREEVVSADGEILGASPSGRESACRDAEITVLSRRAISALSYEEFVRVAFPVPVRQGRSRGDALTQFAGDESHLRRLLATVYDRSPGAHLDGEKKSEFITRIRASLAKNCDIGSSDFYSASIEVPEMKGRLFLVLHQERLSPELALRYAYKGECESAGDVARKDEPRAIPRERA